MPRRANLPVLLAIVSCAATQPQVAGVSRPAPVAARRIDLSPCTSPTLKRPAKCGTARVLEDRASPHGRVVPLNVIVVPAERSPALPDPVVYMEGGPGGAATESIPDVLEAIAKASTTRDLVFVDQRGTGLDSPLRCKVIEGTDLGTLAGGELPESRLKACLAKMDADPSFYTTDIAADDLDEVLGGLGYEKVNVMGGSYGTFAAQAFAKAHPGRVRSLVLNGVVSPNEEFVLGFASSSEAVLEQLFAECAADAACHARHPDPRGELERASTRLREHPVQLSAEVEGKRYTATLDANAFAMTVRSSLYHANTRGGALGMIHDVAEGRFDGIARRVVLTPLAIFTELSTGAYLSIACAESLAGVTEEEARRVTAKTFLGMARVGPVLRACSYWPKRPSPAWLHQPVEGDVPALLLNGTMDPATPLAGLEVAAARLPHGQRVIVQGAGHDVGGPCIGDIVAAFLDHPLATIDTSCVKSAVTRFDEKAD